jgi:two-component system sensor histidine kinase PhoQ
MAIMGHQIERMNQQISFQLRRASLRRSGLIHHQVALAPLLDTLETALHKVHHGKEVTLERTMPDRFMLHLEHGALLEVLGNLLENAYRFCINRVRVSAQHLSDGDLLVVEDDGPGVAEDQRERILRRGERLDTRHPGQGIGLAVAKDILDSYSATLTPDDSPLGGARFIVFFPRYT